MFNSDTVKKEFPIFANLPSGYSYLDNAATSQKPKQVIEKIKEFYENYNANPHRGAYTLSMEATEVYENTRTTIVQVTEKTYMMGLTSIIPETISFSNIDRKHLSKNINSLLNTLDLQLSHLCRMVFQLLILFHLLFSSLYLQISLFFLSLHKVFYSSKL